MKTQAWTSARTLALACFTALSVVVAILAGCGGAGPVDPPVGGDMGSVLLRVVWPVTTSGDAGARVIPPETEVLRVIIDAPDMEPIDTTITENDVIAGVVARSLPVPVGEDRQMLCYALDGAGVILAAGKATFDVAKGETVRARVVLVPVDDNGDPVDPPEVQSRTFILTEFNGNFAPLVNAGDAATDGGTSLREAVTLRQDLPSGALSGSLTLDVYDEPLTGRRPVVGTFIIHNATELWIVRGYYQGPLQSDLIFDPLAANDYVNSGGGWTTEFGGSLLDQDLVVGGMLEGLSAPSALSFHFDSQDPLEAEEMSGAVDVRTQFGRAIIGAMDGQLVF